MCAYAGNQAADMSQSASDSKSLDSRQGATGAAGALATIGSLASSIEERKISKGSSLSPASLPQPLTPRTAALLQRISEAAASRPSSRLKPADSSSTEGSGEAARPAPGASLSDADAQVPGGWATLAGSSAAKGSKMAALPAPGAKFFDVDAQAQGKWVTLANSTQDSSGQAISAEGVDILEPHRSAAAAAQPARALDETPPYPALDAPLGPSGVTSSERQVAEPTSGIDIPADIPEPGQVQASPQKRPAKALPPSLEEDQPQSPKKRRTSGKIRTSSCKIRCVSKASR